MRAQHFAAITALACTAVMAVDGAAGLGPASAAQEGMRAKAEQRTISVSGTVQVKAAPDRARVTFDVQTNAKTAELAVQGNANATDRVVRAMKAAVKGKGEVSTSGYNLSPEYRYGERSGARERTLIGYVATNSLSVVTSDLQQVGKLIDEAVGAGATGAGSVSFFREDTTGARRQALVEAGRKARAEADAIAESLGIGLGEVLHASSSMAVPIGPQPKMLAMRSMAAEADTPIEPGDVNVSATVQVLFAID